MFRLYLESLSKAANRHESSRVEDRERDVSSFVVNGANAESPVLLLVPFSRSVLAGGRVGGGRGKGGLGGSCFGT